ncbi:hypothetical protein E3N88_04342 [Mikania micrantha]|uniref:Uncharacterized protein n=1 Tax=Mikania micrantha TaxID=192012 RepID=A0A5N6PU75_9ASTR|nr:hypothetical protein E3N88_04342 [Mikania micrantha]
MVRRSMNNYDGGIFNFDGKVGLSREDVDGGVGLSTEEVDGGVGLSREEVNGGVGGAWNRPTMGLGRWGWEEGFGPPLLQKRSADMVRRPQTFCL